MSTFALVLHVRDLPLKLSCNRTDPETKEVLQDTTLRSNIPLRQSIVEWRELIYCFIIRSLRENLLSNSDKILRESLSQIQALIRENSVNKDWISIGELTGIIISNLGNSYSREVKMNILITLKDAVEGHARNKVSKLYFPCELRIMVFYMLHQGAGNLLLVFFTSSFACFS